MRGRRAAAWFIDTAALWLAMILVGPLALIHALVLRQEAAEGIGLFDPSTAGAIARDGFRWGARGSGLALLLVFAWAIAQLSALLAARRTIGKSALGLALSAASAAERPARGRVLAREMSRFALLAALPLAHAYYAYPRFTKSGWELFAPGEVPVVEPASIWRTLIVVGGLMVVSICVTVWEAVLVAADPSARTLGDRIARTRVVKRDS
jgi:hypothetical protein